MAMVQWFIGDVMKMQEQQMDEATRGFVAMGFLARRVGRERTATHRQKLIGAFVEAYSQVLSEIDQHPELADGVIRLKTEAVRQKNRDVIKACHRVEGAYNRRPTEFRAAR